MPGYKVVAAGGLNLCPECGLVLKEAVQTLEGIRFCKSCFEDIISKQPNHKSRKTGLSVTGDDGKGAAAGDAFREHRADLLIAVTDVHVLANSLYSEGLISPQQLEQSQLLALTPSVRKVHLFNAIEARLRIHPRDIYALLDILDSDPLLQIFTERIRTSHHKNLCEKHRTPRIQQKRYPVVFRTKFDDEDAPPVHDYNRWITKRFSPHFQPSNPHASWLPCDDEQVELEDKIEEYVEPDPDVSVTKGGFVLVFCESIDDGKKVERSYMVNEEYEHASEKTRGIEESNEPDESVNKKGLLSGVRQGIRKLYGAARDMTAGLIKSTLSVLKLDIKIFRKYKKRFNKHTDREQVRWWFEIWGDESALKALESKWEEVSAENKWRLETCCAVPPQKC